MYTNSPLVNVNNHDIDMMTVIHLKLRNSSRQSIAETPMYEFIYHLQVEMS